MKHLPSFERYAVAVSRPDIFFSDPEIRARMPAYDHLGQLVFFSGRYAFTFRLTLPDGRMPIAVRCFQQEIANVVDRYRAIDDFLKSLGSRFFVGFSVAAPTAAQPDRGVRIESSWFPAMRMDWVDGTTLSAFVGSYATEPNRLRTVRDELLEYSRLTETARFAHCDIHPDNIVIGDKDRLFLVDYDGMFVPTLIPLGGEVAGQPDFQLPARMRAPAYFAADLDRFPLMLLDLTLAALELAPGLLARRTPGEGILLGRADFEAPDTSALLAEIEALPGFAEPMRIFRIACQGQPQDMPTLDGFRACYGVKATAGDGVTATEAYGAKATTAIPRERTWRVRGGIATIAVAVLFAITHVYRHGKHANEQARQEQSVMPPSRVSPVDLPAVGPTQETGQQDVEQKRVEAARQGNAFSGSMYFPLQVQDLTEICPGTPQTEYCKAANDEYRQGTYGVVRCGYYNRSENYSWYYFYWLKNVPYNMAKLSKNNPRSAMRTLGTIAVQECPKSQYEAEALYQQNRM